jgi:tetratricopeptide (TPR) repeat protein
MRIESLRDLLSQFPDIDGYWDFEDFEKTENKIKELLPQKEDGWTPAEIETLTQLARVQGLQGKLSDAGATLIRTQDLVSKMNGEGAKRAEVRFLIEQGRFFGLSMNASRSIAYFSKAWSLISELDEPFFSIEAAVMLSVSQPPKYQNEWLLEGLKLAETSKDEKAKLWLPRLYEMKAWHAFDFRKYGEALDNFNKALLRLQNEQDSRRTVSVKWSVGRVLRALDRIQEALEIQKSLHAELSSAGKINGHVSLEIAECLQSQKNYEEAKSYFEAAYKELSLNGWYADNRSNELSRMQHLSKKK